MSLDLSTVENLKPLNATPDYDGEENILVSDIDFGNAKQAELQNLKRQYFLKNVMMFVSNVFQPNRFLLLKEIER